MTDLQTLTELREEAFATQVAAEQIGNFALAVAAQEARDGAADMILKLVEAE